MEKKRITINISFLIFLYLYTPILIFLYGWIKWYFAIPAIFLILFFVYKMDGSEMQGELFTWKGLLVLLGCAVLLLIWCILSGQGAFVVQAGDWGKYIRECTQCGDCIAFMDMDRTFFDLYWHIQVCRV